MSEKSYNPFHMAQAQFDKVADYLELDQGTRDLLRNPMREYHVSIPIKMDDGTTGVFRASAPSTTIPVAPARAASASIPTKPLTLSAPFPCG